MTMAAILEETRNHLRTTYAWNKDQCRVAALGEPTGSSGEFFIGIDEESVDPMSDTQVNDYLGEVYRIAVWIWRRSGVYGDDRRGDMLLPDDPHLGTIQTMEKLTRKVIVAIHKNQDLRAAVNTRLAAPSNKGDIVQSPLSFNGRSRTQPRNIEDGGAGDGPWMVRTVRFIGMKRVQSLECMG